MTFAMTWWVFFLTEREKVKALYFTSVPDTWSSLYQTWAPPPSPKTTTLLFLSVDALFHGYLQLLKATRKEKKSKKGLEVTFGHPNRDFLHRRLHNNQLYQFLLVKNKWNSKTQSSAVECLPDPVGIVSPKTECSLTSASWQDDHLLAFPCSFFMMKKILTLP